METVDGKHPLEALKDVREDINYLLGEALPGMPEKAAMELIYAEVRILMRDLLAIRRAINPEDVLALVCVERV